ncbi:Iron-sulfur assembly protein [Sphaerulina musiva]
MALPSIPRTCVFAFRSTSRQACTRAHHTPAYQPTPLYLDFLAPSWRPRAQSPRQVYPSCRRAAAPHSRSFTTHFPLRATKTILNPRKDDSGNEMSITITPRAAYRLQKIAEKDSNPDLALRVAVESGGCHGFQYLMSLTSVKDADSAEDSVFENEERVDTGDQEGYRAKVIMDEPSLELLKGSSVDYTMELIGSQFKVVGIPGAKSSCGCGTSFDIAA